MTDHKTIIAKHPLTVKFVSRWLGTPLMKSGSDNRLCENVRVYAETMLRWDDHHSLGISALLDKIESHLSASRPKPLTEEDVKEMKWPCDKETDAATKSNTALHNIQIDRLWSAVLAERAEVARLRAELEASR